MQNTVKFFPQIGNRVLISARTDKSVNPVAPFLLVDIPLDPRNRTVIERVVNDQFNPIRAPRLNSRHQPVHRIAQGPSEVFLFLPLDSPVESLADLGAEQYKVDVALFVAHVILNTRERKFITAE